MARRLRWPYAVAAALLLAGPAWADEPAKAGPAEQVGTVLALDAGEIVVDLGQGEGLSAGSTVELWRPLKLKHPVTGKTVSDRFRIGTLELTQVRQAMSLARPVGELSRPAERGDVIIAPRKKAPETGPVLSETTVRPTDGEGPANGSAPEPMSPEDRDALVVAAMFESLAGADLAPRIRAYEAYVRAKPQGRYARVLYEEAQNLRKLYELTRDAKPSSSRAGSIETVQFEGVAEAEAGSPLSIAIELSDAAKGAVLHMRTRGEPAYTSLPMRAEGNGYFAVVVPMERISPPEVQYFIEATGDDGQAVAVAGEASQPRSFQVRSRLPFKAPDAPEARFDLWTDYADYNRSRGNDRIWQTEGTIGMRLGDTGIRAVRSGFGVYRGVGGTIHELDDLNLSGRKVGLTYGYLEGEFGATENLSIIARLAVGLLDEGVSGGAQGLVRIGNDKGTNLVLGGEVLGGVGLRTIAELNLNKFYQFPIVIRSEVTDQPAGVADNEPTDETVSSGEGDIGVRGIVQAGYRIVDPLVFSIRGSFQGRNIKHAGPGFGAGVSFTW